MALNVSSGIASSDARSVTLQTIQLPHVDGRPRRTLSGIDGDMMFECAKAMYPWEVSFALSLIAKTARGGTMIDVGANIGTNLVLTADLFRHCHAIEPSSVNASILQYNIANNGIRNTTIHPVALSNRRGRAPLFLNQDENSGGHSLSAAQAGGSAAEEVEVHTLDDLLPDVADCTFLHIDTEGDDINVLEGARNFLRRQRHRPLIEIEFCPRALVRRSSSVGTLVSIMDEFGYSAVFAANRNYAPMSRTALTELFYEWRTSTGWIDLSLLPEKF